MDTNDLRAVGNAGMQQASEVQHQMLTLSTNLLAAVDDLETTDELLGQAREENKGLKAQVEQLTMERDYRPRMDEYERLRAEVERLQAELVDAGNEIEELRHRLTPKNGEW